MSFFNRNRMGRLGAAFSIVPGGFEVPAQAGELSCGNWKTVPVISDLRIQAENINAVANIGDFNYIWYKDNLYKFMTYQGQGPNGPFKGTSYQMCGNFDPKKLPPGTLPGGVIPSPPGGNPVPIPVPPGGVKPVGYFTCPDGRTVAKAEDCGKGASNILPIAVGVLALAGGVGLAYMVTRKAPKTASELAREQRALRERRMALRERSR